MFFEKLKSCLIRSKWHRKLSWPSASRKYCANQAWWDIPGISHELYYLQISDTKKQTIMLVRWKLLGFFSFFSIILYIWPIFNNSFSTTDFTSFHTARPSFLPSILPSFIPSFPLFLPPSFCPSIPSSLLHALPSFILSFFFFLSLFLSCFLSFFIYLFIYLFLSFFTYLFHSFFLRQNLMGLSLLNIT